MNPCARTRGRVHRSAPARESGEAPCHIVPSRGTRGHWEAGMRSRALLQRYDIGVNDAANGVPVRHPRPHNEMHTEEFL